MESKMKKKVSKVKEKIRDDSRKIDRNNRQGVRKLGWHETCTMNSLWSHSFNNYLLITCYM